MLSKGRTKEERERKGNNLWKRDDEVFSVTAGGNYSWHCCRVEPLGYLSLFNEYVWWAVMNVCHIHTLLVSPTATISSIFILFPETLYINTSHLQSQGSARHPTSCKEVESLQSVASAMKSTAVSITELYWPPQLYRFSCFTLRWKLRPIL